MRDRIHRIALEWPSYGARRIAAELHKAAVVVNRKKLQRIMREDNLLCLRKRRFVLTTDSRHVLPVYRNLAAEMTLTAVNQLWIADITYIRLEEEFVYLAVILDAWSRRVIGWCVDDTLDASLAIRALEMALESRRANGPVVHHSDRGVQYASQEYTALLEANGFVISMSRKANPWDNARCESFMKTLKSEEVNRSEYRNLADARTRLGQFIEAVYNARRLHSALGYLSPEEFERRFAEEALSTAAA